MSGTPISAEAVRFDTTRMWVTLSDGREIGVPLSWFPRLHSATKHSREKVELSPFGLHWPDLDEDISRHPGLDPFVSIKQFNRHPEARPTRG